MRTSMANRHCPMARAMGEIGDGWTMMILWAALNGVTRFDAMQQRLGLARNILADRLRRMTEAGLIERRPVAEGGKRCEYLPTARAMPLREPLAMIRAWGVLHAGGSGSSAHPAFMAHLEEFGPTPKPKSPRGEVPAPGEALHLS